MDVLNIIERIKYIKKVLSYGSISEEIKLSIESELNDIEEKLKKLT